MILIFAEVGRPLFGSLWLAGLLVCAAIVALLAVVALVGRWLAATHPEPVLSAAAAPASEETLNPETAAIIACAVHAAFGSRAQITAVSLASPHAPSVEALMLQWSLEGRRQIYTSHKVR
jgi:hypothetical protein